MVDNSPNLVSVVTIIYWLFHGKTDRFLNVFPKPGIKPKDIERGSSFGKEIELCLRRKFRSQLNSVDSDGSTDLWVTMAVIFFLGLVPPSIQVLEVYDDNGGCPDKPIEEKELLQDVVALEAHVEPWEA